MKEIFNPGDRVYITRRGEHELTYGAVKKFKDLYPNQKHITGTISNVSDIGYIDEGLGISYIVEIDSGEQLGFVNSIYGFGINTVQDKYVRKLKR